MLYKYFIFQLKLVEEQAMEGRKRLIQSEFERFRDILFLKENQRRMKISIEEIIALELYIRDDDKINGTVFLSQQRLKMNLLQKIISSYLRLK